MIRRWCCFLVLMAFFGNSFSQNVDFVERNFTSNPGKLDTALAEIAAGDSLFYKNKDGSDQEALRHYLVAQQINGENAFLNYKIGACYLNSPFKAKALPCLRKAMAYDVGVNPDLLYLLGQAYHHAEKFDSALICYDIFENRFYREFSKGMLPGEIKLFREEFELVKSYSRNALEVYVHPLQVNIRNMGPVINSSDPEYNPKISAGNDMLLFTARHSGTTGGGKHGLDEKFYEDIYVSFNQNGTWSLPENLGRPVNTDLNDGIIAISVDGQTLLTDYGGLSGDIYVSKRYGTRWSRPEKLPREINTDEIESSACWAPDGNSIFFTSDRPGGYGGGDIYVAGIDPDGSIRRPENLGPIINTPYNEESVFIHPDGKSLYFSSEGHNSIGGYDIFKSILTPEGWSKPENLGYPVNTVDDDVFFTIAADGKTAYYSSERNDGFGGQDIYCIDFTPDEKKTTAPSAMKLMNGRILDAVDLQAIAAKIEIYDNVTGKVLFITHSNASTGKFSFALPSGRKYGLHFSAPGYLFHSMNLDLSTREDFENKRNNVFLYRINRETRPEEELQKALRGKCLQIQVSPGLGDIVDPANGNVAGGMEPIVRKDVEKALQRNRDRLILLFDAGIDMEDVIDLVGQEIIRKISPDSMPCILPEQSDFSKILAGELKAFRKGAELNLPEIRQAAPPVRQPGSPPGRYFIDLLQITKDAINDTTGEIETPGELEPQIYKNILSIVLDNKHIIDNQLKTKTSPAAIRQELCAEIILNGGNSRAERQKVHSKSVNISLGKALALVYPALYPKSIFDINLPEKKVFDCIKQEVTPESKDALFRILSEAAIDNSGPFEMLFASGKTLPEIQNRFLDDQIDFLRQAGLPLTKAGNDRLKALSDEVVENLFLDLNLIHVFDNQKMGDTLRPEQAVRMKTLVSKGLTFNQLEKMLSRSQHLPAETSIPVLIGDSSLKADALQSKITISQNIGALMPGDERFDCRIFETTREAINDADGSFDPAMKEFIGSDVDRIIDQHIAVITSLLCGGVSSDSITRSLAAEISRKSGAVDDHNRGIVYPALYQLVNECLRAKTRLIEKDRAFWREETLGMLLAKPVLDKADTALILQRSCSMLKSNKASITALLKSGKSMKDLKEWIIKDLALQSAETRKKMLEHLLNRAFDTYLDEDILVPPRYEAHITLNNIFFGYDRIELQEASQNELGKLLDLLRGNPETRIVICGHSDNIGSDEYNMQLSLRRAKSVEAYLVAKGIAPARIVAKGYGKTRPVVPNNFPGGIDNPEGRALNR